MAAFKNTPLCSKTLKRAPTTQRRNNRRATWTNKQPSAPFIKWYPTGGVSSGSDKSGAFEGGFQTGRFTSTLDILRHTLKVLLLADSYYQTEWKQLLVLQIPLAAPALTDRHIEDSILANLEETLQLSRLRDSSCSRVTALPRCPFFGPYSWICLALWAMCREHLNNSGKVLETVNVKEKYIAIAVANSVD